MSSIPSHLVSSRLLYFADDSNIPSNPHDKQIFLAAARNDLLDQVITRNRMIADLLKENAELRSRLASA